MITEKFGDLGNRLFRYARLLAAKPKTYWVIDLSFFQYSYLFSPRIPSFWLLFRLLSLVGGTKFARLRTWLENSPHVQAVAHEDPTAEATCEKLFESVLHASSRLCLLKKNSYFAAVQNPTQGYESKLRRIFVLKTMFRDRADALLRPLRKKDSKLVVVHLRRNDYRTYADGAYYFSDEVYARVIRALQTTATGSPQFLLVSDEPLQPSNFSPVTPLYFGRQDVGVDQALLASADYILGPESTFSAWPAFLHHIPRAVLRTSDQSVAWSDFGETGINYVPQ